MNRQCWAVHFIHEQIVRTRFSITSGEKKQPGKTCTYKYETSISSPACDKRWNLKHYLKPHLRHSRSCTTLFIKPAPYHSMSGLIILVLVASEKWWTDLLLILFLMGNYYNFSCYGKVCCYGKCVAMVTYQLLGTFAWYCCQHGNLFYRVACPW